MAVSCPSVSTYKKKCNIQRVRVRFFGIGIYVLPKPFPPCPQKKTVTPFSLVPDDLQFPQVENHTVKTINLHIKCQQFRKICDISRECDFDGVGNVCVRFFFFQSSSRLFQLTYFVNCRRTLLELKSPVQKQEENFVAVCLRPP